MRKFYGFFDNGKYKVGCNGGSIYVYDQNDTELTRFKGLSCAYKGAFRPGSNVFVAKSIAGTLTVYNLDELKLIKKIIVTRIGAQDEGFAFSPSGDLFYNIEKPKRSTQTQLSVYDGFTFEKKAVYFENDENVVLDHIETYENDIYLFGFFRGDNGIFDYLFTSKFADGELREI